MPSIGRASYESRPGSDRLLHFWTLGAIIVTIATAITLAFWSKTDAHSSQVPNAGSEISCGDESWPYGDLRCRGDSAENKRRIRLITTDRIKKTSVNTITRPVEIPIVSLGDTVENTAVSRSSAAVEDSLVLKPMPAQAAAILPSAGAQAQVPSPSTRAQVRSRARNTTAAGRSGGNAERQPVPELASAPRGYSFTGGGRAFDAVH
jgi:hypothetical protein